MLERDKSEKWQGPESLPGQVPNVHVSDSSWSGRVHSYPGEDVAIDSRGEDAPIDQSAILKQYSTLLQKIDNLEKAIQNQAGVIEVTSKQQIAIEKNINDLNELARLNTVEKNISGLKETFSELKAQIFNIEQNLNTMLSQISTAFEQILPVINRTQLLANISLWRLPVKENELLIRGVEEAIDLKSLRVSLQKGVDRVNFLLNQGSIDLDKELKYHVQVANLACRMLQKVMRNEPFHATVRRLAKTRDENEIEFIRLAINIDEFCQQEEKLLKLYNLPNADGYVNKSREILEAVHQGRIPQTNIYTAISNLGKVVCQLNDRLEAIDQARRRKILLKTIMGIGWVLVAIINVQADNMLSPAQATLSVLIASGGIEVFTADIWSLL